MIIKSLEMCFFGWRAKMPQNRLIRIKLDTIFKYLQNPIVRKG